MEKEIILLDSSIWIKLLKMNIDGFRRYFNEIKLIPLLTVNNMIEILDVNTSEMKERLKKLNDLPVIAVLNYQKNYVGSQVDLLCYEVDVILNMNLKTAQDLKDYINNKIKKINVMFPEAEDEIILLKQNLGNIRRKNHLISLVNNYEQNPYYNKKIKELLNLEVKNREDVNPFDAVNRLANYAREKGLPVKKSENLIKLFGDMVKSNDSFDDIKGNASIINLIKHIYNIEYVNINRKYKFYHVNYLKKLQLENISRVTGISYDSIIKNGLNQYFSLNLHIKLKDILDYELYTDKPRKVELSNSIDIDLASHSLYFTVVVDNRTKKLHNMLINRKYSEKLYMITEKEFNKKYAI